MGLQNIFLRVGKPFSECMKLKFVDEFKICIILCTIDGEILLVTKDGTVVQQSSDGSKQRLNSDGTLVTLLPDHTIEVVRRDPYSSTSSGSDSYTSSSSSSGSGGDYAGRGGLDLISITDSDIANKV